MNCPTGKPGTPAYAMSAEESLSNMARLSLCGKLNLAIEKCNLYPFLIPYYGSKEFMTEQKTRNLQRLFISCALSDRACL